MKVDILRNICCIVFIYVSQVKAQVAIRGFNFLRDYRFDDYVLNHGLIWQISTVSEFACAVNCVSEKACMSYHFHRGSRECRGYETLMLTKDAGTHEEGWIYFYLTSTGRCPLAYGYSREFEYCVGYEGQLGNDEGFSKCQEKGGRYLLIRSAEENRFASLLAFNFNHLTEATSRQMLIQGVFNFTEMVWKDDSGKNLTFQQFVTGKGTPIQDEALLIKQTLYPENFMMTHRLGNINPSVVVCSV